MRDVGFRSNHVNHFFFLLCMFTSFIYNQIMVEVRKFVYDQIPYELFIFKKLIIHSSNEGTCFANKSFKVFVLV